jgi:hypothetical protein
MGGLCQGAIRRAKGGAGLSLALHPPHRHLQPPLIRADAAGVTFTVKNYRVDGPGRYTTMTLAAHEFIRRFLMHVLANGNRAAAIAKAR